jgi:hypothetical protein
MKKQFESLKTEDMTPDVRIIRILRFIQENHKGIFKCLVNEIKYCIKMVSTGRLNDFESLNRQISE